MNILISTSRTYLDKAETMLYSLSQNCSEKITVYLLNRSLTNKDLEKLKKFLNKNSVELCVIDFPDNYFENFPVPNKLSVEIYFRIFAWFLLPENLDRILWLDADIIVDKDISEFYNQDFEGNCIAAVRDIEYKESGIAEHKKNIGLLPQNDYFNAGVILFNLPVIRKKYTPADIINACNNLKDVIKYQDQDILNYLYRGEVKYSNFKYNHQLTYLYSFRNRPALRDELAKKLKDACIIHYSGPIKPWRVEGHNEPAKYYWHYVLKRKKYLTVACHYALIPVYSVFYRIRKVIRKLRKAG